MRKLLFVLSLVVGLTAACTVGMQEGPPTTWDEFLAYLVQPTGAAFVVGWLLSIGIEYIPGFPELAPKWKRAAFFGVCLVVPLVAAAVGVLAAGWPPDFGTTFWPALVTGFTVFGTGTMIHLPKLPDAPEGE